MVWRALERGLVVAVVAMAAVEAGKRKMLKGADFAVRLSVFFFNLYNDSLCARLNISLPPSLLEPMLEG